MRNEPEVYLDQQLSQVSRTFGEKRKVFHEEMVRRARAAEVGHSQGKVAVKKGLTNVLTRSSQSLKRHYVDLPLQANKESSKKETASLSRANYKSAQTSTTKLHPEISFDTVKKSRQGSLVQMTFSGDASQSLTSTVRKRADRSLSKCSITNAKILVKASQSKPLTALSPKSNYDLTQTSTFNRTHANMLGGLSDIPMFKTTAPTL